MSVVPNGHAASRLLKVAAVATVAVTVLATGLACVLTVRLAPLAVQAVIGVGLVSVLLEIVLALWSIRTVEAMGSDRTMERTRFISTAVHDLRQPLQAATLFVDSLIHSPIGPQPLKAAQALDLSIQSVRHILDDMLDISRLDGGVLVVQPKAFSLIALLHTLEAEFAPLAIAKNLRFCLYCPATDWYVNSDLQLVLMLVRKQLLDAIAETHQGGILLGVRRRSNSVLIQVYDTRANTQREPGKTSARGVLIAHRVAALIQSPLVFESKTGHGARCTLTLAGVKPQP
jgi:signal transduction histidine kinase